MLATVLIVILVLFAVGALPSWGHMQGLNLGYGPSGLLGVLVVFILLLALMGRI